MMEATGYASPETFWGTAVPKVWNPPRRRSRFGDVVLVLFLLAQCFDGVFTYVGVMTFGIGIEANPLITGLMLRFGEGAALVGAKCLASVLGIALHLREVHNAVALLAAFYFGVAILPWTAILLL
jgi:uncharacterized membrane protein